MGVPVDAGAAGFFGLLVNALNQGSSCSFSTGCFGSEQILEVTGRADGDGATMEKVMCQTDQLSAGFGCQSIDRLIGIEEACPGFLSNLRGQRGWAGSSVETRYSRAITGAIDRSLEE